MDSNSVARLIDHTLLKPDAVEADIIRLCDEAVEYGFASVCVNPVHVPLAYARLKDTGIKVCTVAGFPLGATFPAVKAAEARTAVLNGAAEVDMVADIGAIKEGKYDVVRDGIAEVVRAVRDTNPAAIVKVIIETCLLTDAEKVAACQAASAAGAHFVKTSTGFSSGGATVPDVELMRKTVGPNMGVKASGGIRTAGQALEFIRAGATRIGTSSGVAIMREIAAIG